MNHLYENLKKRAIGAGGNNALLTRILMVLDETLSHFKIPPSERKIVAEALLRFRIVKDRNFHYQPDDKLLTQFLSMDQYFGHRLQQTAPSPHIPTEQRLTEQQLSAYNTDHLFHRLWTKAVGTDNYDKKEWQALEERLQPFFQ